MLPTLRKEKRFFPSIVDDFFGRDFMPDLLDFQTGVNLPSVNIKEGKDEYKIEVAAPGLEKKDFRIDLENNVLTITSEKEDKKEEDREQYMRREFSYSSFKRSFALPQSVDSSNITATHKDGILSIVIPKKEEAKVKPSKQIEIS